MSINKINGSASDTLSKVNGTNDALLCNMLRGGLNNPDAPMFNSHSVDFNGSSNYIDLATVVADINTDRGTVAIWFKIDTDVTCQIWKCNQSSSAANNQLQIYYNASNNKVTFQQKYNGTSVSYTSDAITAGDDSWHFAAMTWTAVGMQATLNDTSSELFEQEGTAFTPGSCMAGRNSAAANLYFDGHINEIGMWDAQLSEAACGVVYNNGKGINLTKDVNDYNNASDLIGYWKMEENTGTTIVDSSGGGETGTLSHSSLFTTDTN
mgnify:CR=1 FL=1